MQRAKTARKHREERGENPETNAANTGGIFPRLDRKPMAAKKNQKPKKNSEKASEKRKVQPDVTKTVRRMPKMVKPPKGERRTGEHGVNGKKREGQIRKPDKVSRTDMFHTPPTCGYL